ncbi:MAG: hypothetical protein J6U07_07000 [Fibrobacter sp.]|jgi:chromosome segregation ATPase|uniref:hypothetical protein n=1 Tax=Fibrobacter sp. UWP2 TaxID=1896216 RepID=UPI00091FC3E3|nr:hypothetical protein [Fibrobacter sp. UWP2]MBO7384334.1 hypothetical protein [Fibrobacter sp.]SHI87857.1 hypothetical protein SAMN05720471_1105 [Fibrobacter sp. UWP2]
MKTSSFLTGVVLGAVATVAVAQKFFNGKIPCCCANAEPKGDADANPALQEAEGAVETLRNSVDSLRAELNKRIESEQTFAAKCEELNDQVAKQNAEIDNLKNICDVQNGANKKLEEELAQAKAGK